MAILMDRVSLRMLLEGLKCAGQSPLHVSRKLAGIDEVGAPARADAGTVGPLDGEGLGFREDAVVGVTLGNGGKHETQVRFLDVSNRGGLVPEVRGPAAKDEGIVDASKVGVEEHGDGHVGL